MKRFEFECCLIYTEEEIEQRVSEYEEKVAISIICKNFNYKIKPISFLFSVGLLRAHSRREILYGLIDTWKPSPRHARNVLANVVPTIWYEHHDVRPPEVMVDRLG